MPSWPFVNKRLNLTKTMTNDQKKSAPSKLGAKVTGKVKDYGNDPFVVKKVKESKAYLEKYGFPRELTLEK